MRPHSASFRCNECVISLAVPPARSVLDAFALSAGLIQARAEADR